MARRFGKFNPRQPRDSHGRWTSGGSKTSKNKAKLQRMASSGTRGRKGKHQITGEIIGGSIATATAIGSGYFIGSTIVIGATGARIGGAIGRAVDQRNAGRKVGR